MKSKHVRARITNLKVTAPLLGIFIACISFFAFACHEKDYSSKKYMGLKGKIASIRDSAYNCTLRGFYPGSGELSEIQTIDFDTKGNAIRIAKCNADSSYVVITEYVYRDNALFSSNQRVRVGEDSFTNTSERISIKNDTLKYKESNGTQQWIREVKTTGKYHLERTKGEYGYSKEEAWADNNNNIIKTRYMLVSNELDFSNGTNTLEKISTTKFDKNGEITETVYIENNDTAVTVYSYHLYDKYGNWTEERSETNRYFKQLKKRTIKYVE